MSRALAALVLASALVWVNLPGPIVTSVANPSQQFGVAVTPSSVTVKVGEKANVNVTLITSGDMGLVCFSLEGFPETGFRTSFEPECAVQQVSGVATVLTVEATPAAAPQSFTAFVIAKTASQTARTPFNITVEPAMPAWIPWLGIVLFFLILGVAVVWKPKLLGKRSDRSKRKRKD